MHIFLQAPTNQSITQGIGGGGPALQLQPRPHTIGYREEALGSSESHNGKGGVEGSTTLLQGQPAGGKIGRASCRERV